MGRDVRGSWVETRVLKKNKKRGETRDRDLAFKKKRKKN
jgi:hypothetical protein